MDTGRRPSPVQQLLNRSDIQRPKFMDESDPGVELRVPGETLFDARHSDQHQTDTPMVKDIPHLLKSRDLETIGFVNDEQSCGIRNAAPYSHRAIPLLIESIFGVVRFGTSITIRACPCIPVRTMAGIEAKRGFDRIALTSSKPSCHPRCKSSMTKLKWVASRHCSASSTDVANVTRQSWSQDFKHSWTISLSAGESSTTKMLYVLGFLLLEEALLVKITQLAELLMGSLSALDEAVIAP